MKATLAAWEEGLAVLEQRYRLYLDEVNRLEGKPQHLNHYVVLMPDLQGRLRLRHLEPLPAYIEKEVVELFRMLFA